MPARPAGRSTTPLAQKHAAVDERQTVIAALVEQGVDPKTAAVQAPNNPTKLLNSKARRIAGIAPWSSSCVPMHRLRRSPN